jgi:membrane-bound metal-dependent hydrolase YbcI (DUF457 family)
MASQREHAKLWGADAVGLRPSPTGTRVGRRRSLWPNVTTPRFCMLSRWSATWAAGAPFGARMQTSTHLLIGLAALGRPGAARRNLAALAGALLPDLPAILLVVWALHIQGRSPGEVFGVLYWSSTWQAVFAPTHAFPVWGLALAVAVALRSPLLVAFTASGLIHLACDFPVHVTDAHRQFWPLTDRRFPGPVSYWDPAHYGNVFALLEAVLAVGLTAWMLARFRSRPARAALAAVLLAHVGTLAYFARAFAS